ncbi:hypothetical protein GJ633_06910 [Halorubrum sp. CBA1125]|uniref:hypothetical protein n=1 Tax=Halorubrum sp. CBA1125 TaxID=2668072 RepID=UPI0012E8031D|nr:hypothetical protein [Halorubrum sp. CBA1125]MUW14426.1 hypothetical protein [Halorubrum sp. CBA1125]
MTRQRLVLVLLVAVVLLPMWFVAMQGEPPSEDVALDQSVSDIRPLDGFVDTPTKLSPSQVGVIVWVALLGLLGVLTAFHRFMNELARPDGDARPAADGGEVDLSWLETDDRWIVGYDPPSDSLWGFIAMGGLTALTIVFAALFTGEYLTLARTQYFGVYAFGMFMSLTGLTVSYYAWFMPHVEVAERRDH